MHHAVGVAREPEPFAIASCPQRQCAAPWTADNRQSAGCEPNYRLTRGLAAGASARRLSIGFVVRGIGREACPAQTACGNRLGPQGLPPVGRCWNYCPEPRPTLWHFAQIFCGISHTLQGSHHPRPYACKATSWESDRSCQICTASYAIPSSLRALLSAARSCSISLLPRFSISPLLSRTLISRETASLCVLILLPTRSVSAQGLSTPVHRRARLPPPGEAVQGSNVRARPEC